MKRFANSLTSKAMVTTADKITDYESWLNASHASYTPDRWAQAKRQINIQERRWILKNNMKS